MMGDILLWSGIVAVAGFALEAWKHPGSEAIRHWKYQRERARFIKERLQ